VLVYFLVDEVLHVEGRAVAEGTPEAALNALLAGPTAAEAAAGVVTLIPEGTELLGVDVVGNEATVDLTGVFESGGGSLSMIGRVAQVVFTVTQFAPIDTVSFRLDGVLIAELGGEGIGVDRVQRLDNEYVLPFILPETPWPGQTVSEPIRVTGVSNVFEAQVNYEVFGPDGVILVEGWFMATSGTGTWGTYDATLDPLPSGTTGEVTVRLFEVSAENGDHINVVDVTVQLA
jgi:germination protein M